MDTDTINLKILEDGQIRSVTDPISPANHSSADKLFRLLAELTGGEEQRTRRGHSHTHTHEHTHEQDVLKAGH